ncbi:unnamed protein product [Darwinula stevensoni]|uniref:SURP motif domain-containing protein n=1 Tax=Darwinula stevensoni TaxID=69355 RepID=A0A7R8ZZ12_9CRUS|nr:unnamed protein product [Darwinula stevensoni]CAG0881621.1 unnamed protein product [Darwinula stevensoni]
MSLKWGKGKRAEKEEVEEELLVFGYACKLFRDDEKALHIDQGKHLIPWMGDETLKIDRYDVRAPLWDLKSWEAPPGGYDRFQCLTLEERKVEEMCDEERYLALNHDIDEETFFQEEELKRLKASLNAEEGTYKEVGFSYDNDGNGTEPPKQEEDMALPQEEEAEDDDQEFSSPPGLHLPSDLILPRMMKQHHVIEKTADFVARHGSQMEILVRAKQASNPHFGFLAFDDPLNPYYRHLLHLIHDGRYIPLHRRPPDPEPEEDGEGHYLHPSLSVVKPEHTPSTGYLLPEIPYRPSADSAYAKLVSRLKGIAPVSSGQTVLSAALHRLPLIQAEENQIQMKRLVVLPTSDDQVIIDKMASYVAKNGRSFESIVKNRNDTRFAFLEETHPHHAYYEHKLHVYSGGTQGTPFPEEPRVVSSSVSRELSSAEPSPSASPKTPAGTVSFRVRSRDSDPGRCPPPRPHPLLDQGSSSSGDEDDSSSRPSSEVPSPMPKDDSDTKDGEEEERARVRERLLVAAQEKCQRSRQLQLERKRKAAAFLTRIQQEQKQQHLGSSQASPQRKAGPLVSQPADDVEEIQEGGSEEGMSEREGKRMSGLGRETPSPDIPPLQLSSPVPLSKSQCPSSSPASPSSFMVVKQERKELQKEVGGEIGEGEMMDIQLSEVDRSSLNHEEKEEEKPKEREKKERGGKRRREKTEEIKTEDEEGKSGRKDFQQFNFPTPEDLEEGEATESSCESPVQSQSASKMKKRKHRTQSHSPSHLHSHRHWSTKKRKKKHKHRRESDDRKKASSSKRQRRSREERGGDRDRSRSHQHRHHHHHRHKDRKWQESEKKRKPQPLLDLSPYREREKTVELMSSSSLSDQESLTAANQRLKSPGQGHKEPTPPAQAHSTLARLKQDLRAKVQAMLEPTTMT